MLFSVIIPVYNAEKYIKECIESALNQNYSDFEIILVDDGSTDKSGKICDYYAGQDTRAKVIHKKNGGHTSARQIGLEASVGQYILCMDSDDFLVKDTLVKLSIIINHVNPDMILFDYYRVFEKTISIHKEGLSEGLYRGCSEFIDKVIYDKNQKGLNWGNVSFSLWNKAVKRHIFAMSHKTIPVGVRYGEDFVCIMNELKNSNTIYMAHFPGYNYRINDNSLTCTVKINDLSNVYKVIKAISILNIENFENQISVYYINMLWTLLIGFGKHNSYLNYKNFVENEYDKNYDYLLDLINVELLSNTEKIRYYLCKNQLWSVVYLICRVFF